MSLHPATVRLIKTKPIISQTRLLKKDPSQSTDSSLLTPGLDYTRLFISLTAAAGTICMSLLPSSPSLSSQAPGERAWRREKETRVYCPSLGQPAVRCEKKSVISGVNNMKCVLTFATFGSTDTTNISSSYFLPVIFLSNIITSLYSRLHTALTITPYGRYLHVIIFYSVIFLYHHMLSRLHGSLWRRPFPFTRSYKNQYFPSLLFLYRELFLL